MDWLLHNNGLHHERVKVFNFAIYKNLNFSILTLIYIYLKIYVKGVWGDEYTLHSKSNFV